MSHYREIADAEMNDGHDERGYNGDCAYSRAMAARERLSRLGRMRAIMINLMDEAKAGVADDSLTVAEGYEIKAWAEWLLEASDELPEDGL